MYNGENTPSSISGAVSVWVYFWALYPVPLIYIFVFGQVPYYIDDSSFVVC